MSGTRDTRAFSVLELPALLLVPATVTACLAFNIPYAAVLTVGAALAAIAALVVSLEFERPLMRQLMPTVVLAAVAAAGRLLFAPFPEVKPVSAICIVAGAVLGRRSGFAVGALAALVSNFYFGQGPWTPLQMYAWGLVGYLSGVLAAGGLLRAKPALFAWGFLSALVYGLCLNGWHVIGYVRPLTWAGAAAAFAAGIPLDCIHGAATCAFLALIWIPWEKSLRRAIAKYGLG